MREWLADQETMDPRDRKEPRVRGEAEELQEMM